MLVDTSDGVRAISGKHVRSHSFAFKSARAGKRLQQKKPYQLPIKAGISPGTAWKRNISMSHDHSIKLRAF